MSALFIADLHLSAATPRTSERLIGLLQTHAPLAQELWILGDLFEVWVGDDTLDDPSERRWLDPILEALARFSTEGKRRLLVGNRDFLLGEQFAQATGITLVDEPLRVTVGGVPTLLLHGDTLCTDDLAYQAFRQTVRTPQWKSAFLRKPYAERQQIAAQMRRDSQAAGASKAISIMDANPS
ncbi:MAG: UDP-2,3-diacylglucosamine diphosphatase, partial [Betaproteobacteria bacterium]|nr:UDP-2,3-diacylglucosamine diphosphatase [Betaproteobacteria bacterium]